MLCFLPCAKSLEAWEKWTAGLLWRREQPVEQGLDKTTQHPLVSVQSRLPLTGPEWSPKRRQHQSLPSVKTAQKGPRSVIALSTWTSSSSFRSPPENTNTVVIKLLTHHSPVSCFRARQICNNSSAEADIALTDSSYHTRQEKYTEAVRNSPQNVGENQPHLDNTETTQRMN